MACGRRLIEHRGPEPGPCWDLPRQPDNEDVTPMGLRGWAVLSSFSSFRGYTGGGYCGGGGGFTTGSAQTFSPVRESLSSKILEKGLHPQPPAYSRSLLTCVAMEKYFATDDLVESNFGLSRASPGPLL